VNVLFHELHAALKDRVTLDPDTVPLPDTGQTILNFTFVSDEAGILALSGGGAAAPPLAGESPEEAEDRAISDGIALARDSGIAENLSFRYHLLAPAGLAGEGKAKGVIVLLHGLNERGWAKYLPWASELCRGTGKPVLLFPMAFHMNRTPALWNDTRAMRRVSRHRRRLRPELLHSTVSNAAISARLSADPSRFFWSGLQSYRDLAKLAGSIRRGEHPLIAAGASVDLFTYSIGSFLGEIALCADEGGLFGDSRLVAFCGGPVFNRLYPASKFIVDSAAAVDLHSYLVEHLESRMKAFPALAEHLSPARGEAGPWFRAFLSYRLETARRERRLRELAPRIRALALQGDEVVPPCEVVNTFQGALRDIPIPVDVLEPPCPCRHEDPFPPAPGAKAAEMDACFRKAFAGFSRFLE
jgi:hypothetical protein